MSISNLKKRFSTSDSLGNQGVWIKVVVSDEEYEFKLAHMGRSNRRWNSLSSASYRQNKYKIDNGLMTEEQSIARIRKLFCQAILLDWRGVTDDDGLALPYSPELGEEVMSECHTLYEYLVDEATRLENFQEKEIKETVGKSPVTLNGRKNGEQ